MLFLRDLKDEKADGDQANFCSVVRLVEISRRKPLVQSVVGGRLG